MFGSIKIAMIVIALATAGGGFLHYKTVKADLETAKANNLLLEQSVEGQKAVIAQQENDFKSILAANATLQEQNKVLAAEFSALDERFNKINAQGEVRDIGKLAVERTKSIERVINGATKKAMRCVEIAMGSPLTEKEENATKKSEINSECPSIANPNYIPY
jgi:predicted nuclease with TOPRIM domain|tara:strand:+ start:683 stop:1168 length:486 start_codon:yes stop_codon:yes gene_type:complete